MNLPKNWYKRLDNNPGTLNWWYEYAIWKTLHKCNHGKKHGWIKGGPDCDLAWQCEYDSLFPDRWEASPPPERD